MPQPRHIADDRGFTLIELLVVMLLIGILAAIALPVFLDQQRKADDSVAKHNARTLVSQLEACWHDDGGYVGCTAELTGPSSGLPIGAAPGQVRIVSETTNGYVITAVSKARSAGGGNHTFTVVHNIGGVFDRQCAPAGEGGCDGTGHW